MSFEPQFQHEGNVTGPPDLTAVLSRLLVVLLVVVVLLVLLVLLVLPVLLVLLAFVVLSDD